MLMINDNYVADFPDVVENISRQIGSNLALI